MIQNIPISIQMLRWASLAGVLLWLIIYWQGGLKIFQDMLSAFRQQNFVDAALIMDIGIAALVMLVSAALMLTGILTAEPPAGFQVIAGFLLLVGGITAMFYCRSFLGQYWTAENRIQENHHIVEEGPYGKVRHPIYAFAILMYIGLALVFPVWWNVIALIVIAADYFVKAWLEDRYLLANLPGYDAYCRRVRYRMLPGIW